MILVPLAIFLVGVVYYGATQSRSTGLCQPDETVFFNCKTRHDRQIMLCGHLPEKLQYRFGRSGQVELSWPPNPTTGTQVMTYAHYFRYQAERQTVRFSTDHANYTLFDNYEGNHGHSGVIVIPFGAVNETEWTCKDPVISQLHLLKATLPCDPDNALQGCTP